MGFLHAVSAFVWKYASVLHKLPPEIELVILFTHIYVADANVGGLLSPHGDSPETLLSPPGQYEGTSRDF